VLETFLGKQWIGGYFDINVLETFLGKQWIEGYFDTTVGTESMRGLILTTPRVNLIPFSP
jgi:hypothetical protein